MNRLLIIFLFLIFIVSGCGLNNELPNFSTPFDNPSETPVATSDLDYEDAGTVDSAPLTASPSHDPEPTIAGTIPSEIATSDTLPKATPLPDTEHLLQKMIPPVRDDIRLARAYRGIDDVNIQEQEEFDPNLEIGVREKFNILNHVDNTVGEIEAELLAKSDHAYFWFDTDQASPRPDSDELARIAAAFDDIYGTVVKHFGHERNPGLDGDSRLHVVNASPVALCGVTEETAAQCFLAGLVQPADLLPRSVDPRSNEREMFVMNSHRFGGDGYLGVLAHEFRHLIEDNYDPSDWDWEKEGSATLAAELAGYPSNGVRRGNLFLENPDQQLNSWTEENAGPYYGQGYLFNRYIYDRLGEDIYYQFATSPLPGLHALDSVAEANDLNVDGLSIWLDWLVALAIHNDTNASEIYRFENEGLNTASTVPIDKLPANLMDSVQQYAADYFRLPNENVVLTFNGSPEVSLINTAPTSGERYWFSQRGNSSNPRLTREVDLTKVNEATLIYNVFADIEKGYDFAYVSASNDGGLTWTPLVGENMQGLDAADNPAGSAFTERFYSDRSQRWVREEIDLSQFAGEKILIRFEYVTDPILTYSGLALDDIGIPEIGFFDDVESEDSSWQAKGFVRATEHIPQMWHLKLITFQENEIEVQDLMVDSNGDLTFEVDLGEGDRQPILIVGASAPTTLQPAQYTLNLGP